MIWFIQLPTQYSCLFVRVNSECEFVWYFCSFAKNVCKFLYKHNEHFAVRTTVCMYFSVFLNKQRSFLATRRYLTSEKAIFIRKTERFASFFFTHSTRFSSPTINVLITKRQKQHYLVQLITLFFPSYLQKKKRL